MVTEYIRVWRYWDIREKGVEMSIKIKKVVNYFFIDDRIYFYFYKKI